MQCLLLLLMPLAVAAKSLSARHISYRRPKTRLCLGTIRGIYLSILNSVTGNNIYYISRLLNQKIVAIIHYHSRGLSRESICFQPLQGSFLLYLFKPFLYLFIITPVSRFIIFPSLQRIRHIILLNFRAFVVMRIFVALSVSEFFHKPCGCIPYMKRGW